MHLTSYLDNGKLTIELTGEIDHHCAKIYIDTIGGKIESYNPQTCILDFGGITFMDSSGIAVVINSLRLMKLLGGELYVCDLKDQPLKVFKAAGLEKIVPIKEEKYEI